MSAFVVRREEEGECRYCGSPLFAGDGALEIRGEVYCGHTCADYHKQERESHRAAVARIARQRVTALEGK